MKVEQNTGVKGGMLPTVQRMQAMILVFCDLDTLKGPELMKA